MNSNTEMSILSAFSAAIIVTCFFAVANTFAGQPADQASQETVKFSDLNVGNPAGVAALYQRIHSAAERVCKVGDDRDLARAQRSEACANVAEARAVSRVNSGALTAYYQAKSGHPAAELTASLGR
jgi:UrcA family protein